MRSVRIFVLFSLVSALALPAGAAQKSLGDQGRDAYARKEFARSAELYAQSFEREGGDPVALYNAACGYALAGDAESAFAALERAIVAGFGDVVNLKADPDLASLRGDRRWAPLVARAEAETAAYERFWSSPAIATPYAPNLTDDEKIAGLSKVWSEGKFDFVHFAKVPDLDWDALYVSYIPKVRATTSTFEYYRVLQQFIARLKDGHTGVWMPKELADEWLARPLVRTSRVEDQVVIAEVFDDALRADGVVPGLRVVAVDGVPVDEYAAKNVEPYVGASTPQDLDTRVYDYFLLAGSKSRKVRLTLRDVAGAFFDASLDRVTSSERAARMTPEAMTFRMLPGDVAYVALHSFGTSAAADAFEAKFPEIAKARALVLDVRDNGGGNSDVGYRVLACLTDAPFATSRWSTRDYRPTLRAWGRRETTYGEPAGSVGPAGSRLFTKPVVVLTSARTYSAAEDFVIAFKGMKRGMIVGEPTGGSTGQPLSIALPGGGGARFCTKHDTAADGTEFVGVGIAPDRLVRPALADVRAGRDTVLEAALDALGR